MGQLVVGTGSIRVEIYGEEAVNSGDQAADWRRK